MGNIEQLLQWKEEMGEEHRLYSLGREVIDNPVPVSPVEKSLLFVFPSQDIPPEPPITQGTDSTQKSQEPFSLSLAESKKEPLSDHPPDHQHPETVLIPSDSSSLLSPSTCFHCGSKVLPGVPCGYCNRTSCYCCGSKDFWRSKAGRVICRLCHSPAPGAEELEQKGTGYIAA